MGLKYTTDTGALKIVLACYGTPGIMAIETLFGMSYFPHQISVWTHDADARNQPLLDFARVSEIEVVTFSAKTDAAWEWIQSRQPHVLFSVHFRDRIPARILNIPTYGCVNLHPSLLPEYRGTFSAPWVIINGEKVTGFTYHYMVEKFDAGLIVLQKEVPIKDIDTGFSLFHRLIVEGMKAFEEAFHKVVIERFPGIPQTKGGSYYPRETPFGGEINPDWDEARIERFIRAMIFPPYKGAMVRLGDKVHEVLSLAAYRRLIAEKS